MLHSVIFVGPGRPFERESRPIPELREGEILVRVRCCTLCRSDLHTHAGLRQEATPTVLGHEIVGEIAEFGPASARHDALGTPLTVGSRITWAIAVGCGSCFYCADELPQKCERLFKYGHQKHSSTRPLGGGLANYVVLVPGTVCFLVPAEVPDTLAASCNCATATAAALLRSAGPVTGRSVLVLGAGVLGVTVCAMLRAEGAAQILVSDPRAESRARAKQFGATHVFSADLHELPGSVHRACQGRGADLVFELAGHTSTVDSAFACARIGGTIVLAGTVAPVGFVLIDPEQLVRRMLTVRGVHNYHPRDLAKALSFLAGLGRAYPWSSLVAAEYPLQEADEAFARAHEQSGVRIALVPGETM